VSLRVFRDQDAPNDPSPPQPIHGRQVGGHYAPAGPPRSAPHPPLRQGRRGTTRCLFGNAFGYTLTEQQGRPNFPNGTTKEIPDDISGELTVSVDDPLAFALGGAVPHPAVGSTRIEFTLPHAGVVHFKSYGLRGKRVRTLVNGDCPAGPNSVIWDGRDDQGRALPSGAYFCRLEGWGKSVGRRIIMVR